MVQNVFQGFQNLRLGSIKFARWLQKIVAKCDVLVFWDATIFCNNFARLLQKIVAKCDVLGFLGCSYLLWQLCEMITKDSSNMRWWCVGFSVWDAMTVCNNFARWLQKIVATCDVLVFWDATIFCNNFARWLQQIVAKCDVLVFLGCYYLL